MLGTLASPVHRSLRDACESSGHALPRREARSARFKFCFVARLLQKG